MQTVIPQHVVHVS